MPRLRLWLARLAAPAALLAAATVAVLIVRSALDSDDSARTTPTATVSTQPATTSANPPGAGTTTAPVEAQFYRVQAGDTLETIADQYGTTVEELLALNPDVDPVELSIGERIRVQ